MKRKEYPFAYIFGIVILYSVQLAWADNGLKEDYVHEVESNLVSGLPLECGQLVGHNYGPFDYTNYEHYTEYLPIVEYGHFTREVEALIGHVTGTIIGDLDYTLRAFPNHHRALSAIAKYEFVVDSEFERSVFANNISTDCYFQRAIAFKPLDGTVRLIYGTYLHKTNKMDNALIQYEKALAAFPESSEVHYNIGLFYYDIKKINLAVMHGRKAYALGYPLPGLKEMLIKKGVWNKTLSQN